MSMFTDINGPQNAATQNASVEQLTTLIDKYDDVIRRLSDHEKNSINVSSDGEITGAANVHKLVDALTSLRNYIETELNKKEDKTEVAKKVDITKLEENYYNKDTADKTFIKNENFNTSDVYSKTDVDTELAKKLNIADMYSKNELNTELAKKLNTADMYSKSELDEKLDSKLSYGDSIDLTNFVRVSAPYAGTGIQEDTSTNGLYILGMLSTDIKGLEDTANGFKNKAAQIFVKYINSHPMDANILVSATCTTDDFDGQIFAAITRQKSSWPELAFHLIKNTDSTGVGHVYLCVSSKGLRSGSGEYTNTDFYVAGINFIPVNAKGYVAPNGAPSDVASARTNTSEEGSMLIYTGSMFVNGIDVSDLAERLFDTVGLTDAEINELWEEVYA